MDEYQERYKGHQQRKREMLMKIMEERHSDRIFSDKEVELEKVNALTKCVNLCPTSCGRRAISLKVVSDRDKKNLLGGILVGGTGWINRAKHIFLIFANGEAYKAGDEINFMPYLDAGVVAQQLYLMATTLDLKCCYVNPNIREMNKEHFKNIFGDGLFCGAFAIGYGENNA